MYISYWTKLAIFISNFSIPAVDVFSPILKTLLGWFNRFVLDIQDNRKYGVRSNETN